MKKFSKFFTPFLIRIIAIGLAATAAFFSVTGLAKLFAGTSVAVMIMASVLELAKVVVANWLHENWLDKAINRILKWLLTSMVIVLMCITSAGVYGFLSSGYFDTSNKLSKIDAQINLGEKKKIVFENKIQSLTSLKKTKIDRIDKLTNLRIQQESRIDSLYKKGMVTAVRKTETQIKEANAEIDFLMKEADKIDGEIQIQHDSITSIDIKKVDLSNNDLASEVGSLKYIAKLTNSSMDAVVNWFIIALIFVFDPLAILLLIAANISFEKARNRIKEEQVVKIDNNLGEENKKEDEDREEENEEENEEEESNENNEKIKNDNDVNVIFKEFVENKQKTEKEFKKKIEEINKAKEEDELIEVEYDQKLEEEDPLVTTDSSSNLIVEDVLEEENEIERTEEEKETLYLKLLSILFKDGELNVGSEIFSYKDFLEEIKKQNIDHSEKLIRDFLTTCNLLRVIDTSNNKRVILKDYKTSKQIIKNI